MSDTKYVTNQGYSAKTAGGYTPPKSSSGDAKNIQLPKGGSGASGQPSVSPRQSGSAPSGAGTGTKK